MDINDTITELLRDIPETANVLLAVKPDGSYVLIWEAGSAWKMVNLTKAQGEALATVYPADVKTLNCVTVSVMLANLRARIIDGVLADLL